jgi:hypothetical protein
MEKAIKTKAKLMIAIWLIFLLNLFKKKIKKFHFY